jgi:hypothetical protein
MVRQLLVGHGLLIFKNSRSYRDTPQSVRFLWTGERTSTETTTWRYRQQSQERDVHTPDGIRTRSPRKRAAAVSRLKPRGHRDQHCFKLLNRTKFSCELERITSVKYTCACVYCCIYVCTAVLHTLVAGLLARSQYPEGPATGHLDTGFSWFPWV